MKAPTLLSIAVLTAAVTSARAQGLLDQQLGGPTPAPATAPATMPTTPAPQVKPPADKPQDTIGSPDAVKKVDDDELLKQLLQPNAKPDPDAVKQRLSDMVIRMDDTTKRLTDQKDPGDVTQETERRIIGDLDVMIELARQQQQQSSSSSSSKSNKDNQQSGQPQAGTPGRGGSQANTTEGLPQTDFANPEGADVHNHDPHSWGDLPPRDRQAVANGANDQYLSTYKSQIDRYYQALAELARARH